MGSGMEPSDLLEIHCRSTVISMRRMGPVAGGRICASVSGARALRRKSHMVCLRLVSVEVHYNTPEAKYNLKRFEEFFDKEYVLESAL
jgi:hypothetical protein